MGIPARYVEGYALDPEEISEDGKICSEENKSDYYSGENDLPESGVVSVDITDASAHAWVEVYDKVKGWYVVEVTPYSNEVEGGSFWQRFVQFLGRGNDGNNVESGKENESPAVLQIDQETKRVTAGTIGIIVLLAVVLCQGRLLIRQMHFRLWYKRSSRNDQLISDYQRWLHKIERTDNTLYQKQNYREQLEYLQANSCIAMESEELQQCIQILEQAGFGHSEISPEQQNIINTRLFLKK